MSQSWKFIMTPDGAGGPMCWSWVMCRGGRGVQQSDGTFLTFIGCVTDARLAGFGVTDPFDIIRERRKTPREMPRAKRRATSIQSQPARP
jgi:hypothetical protein